MAMLGLWVRIDHLRWGRRSLSARKSCRDCFLTLDWGLGAKLSREEGASHSLCGFPPIPLKSAEWMGHGSYGFIRMIL
jgi:hypothetical protein